MRYLCNKLLLLRLCKHEHLTARYLSNTSQPLTIEGKTYPRDSLTNITPKILSHIGRNLHLKDKHPLCLIKQNIVNYMYTAYKNRRASTSPLFSVHEQLNPVVTHAQNFDSLLVPPEHVSRKKSDSYYVNAEHMLRAHTTAHQSDLIRMGLNNFLMVGDVYRRDEIDASHYPVFHQLDAVRLMNSEELYSMIPGHPGGTLFEMRGRTEDKQGMHTMDAAKMVEMDLKKCLQGLARHLFGERLEYRWVDAYFPFTHPSWELEVKHNGAWLEVLGCGVMEQQILAEAGVTDKVGWAFGLGLERLAMVLYEIPDIRLFWSTDTGFTGQFSHCSPSTKVAYKPVSKYPQCFNDLSFWLENEQDFSSNDFFDLVRDVCGDSVEQVTLIDTFKHPKTGKVSHCYRIVYRDMSKTLTQEEVNVMHQNIAEQATTKLLVTIR